jgi:integrase
MSRAALALGTHGSIVVIGQQRSASGGWVKVPDGTKAERYRASTRYRDRSGAVRQLERFGSSKGLARQRLNEAISTFEDELELKATAKTRKIFSALAKSWLDQVDRNPKLSASTRRQYRDTYDRYVKGTDLDGQTFAEVNTVPVLRAFLQAVADQRGSGAAKTVRSVLSGIINLAIDDGLASGNACRSIRPVRAKVERDTPRDTRRALTKTERNHLLKVADSHGRAVELDVNDILAYMVGTGVRISEALDQRAEDVDLKAAVVHVRGTKTAASDRVIPMPAWLVKRLRMRGRTTGYLFPSPGLSDQSKPRDRRNVARMMRTVLDEAGFDWATPHSLRRSVATFILEAGEPVTVAQAQLGHADASMTLRVYAAKRAEPSKAAAKALA